MEFNFNPDNLYWFMAYAVLLLAAVGAGQFYMKRVPFLEPVSGLLIWVLYGLAGALLLQFGFPLIGITIF